MRELKKKQKEQVLQYSVDMPSYSSACQEHLVMLYYMRSFCGNALLINVHTLLR